MKNFALALIAALAAVTAPVAFAQTSTTQSFTITVNAAPCTITIAVSPAPPIGIADGKTPYGPYTFTATTTSACVLPLVWTIQAGALPTGLTLSAAGVLSGTISTSDCTTGSCSSAFTVQVTDSGKGPGAKLEIKTDGTRIANNKVLLPPMQRPTPMPTLIPSPTLN